MNKWNKKTLTLTRNIIKQLARMPAEADPVDPVDVDVVSHRNTLEEAEAKMLVLCDVIAAADPDWTTLEPFKYVDSSEMVKTGWITGRVGSTGITLFFTRGVVITWE